MTYFLWYKKNKWRKKKKNTLFCCLSKMSIEFDCAYISQIYRIVQRVSKSLAWKWWSGGCSTWPISFQALHGSGENHANAPLSTQRGQENPQGGQSRWTRDGNGKNERRKKGKAIHLPKSSGKTPHKESVGSLPLCYMTIRLHQHVREEESLNKELGEAENNIQMWHTKCLWITELCLCLQPIRLLCVRTWNDTESRGAGSGADLSDLGVVWSATHTWAALQLLQSFLLLQVCSFCNTDSLTVENGIKTPRASPWRALIYVLICNNAGLNWSSESTFPLPRTETNPSKGKNNHSFSLSCVCDAKRARRQDHTQTAVCLLLAQSGFTLFFYSQFHDSWHNHPWLQDYHLRLPRQPNFSNGHQYHWNVVLISSTKTMTKNVVGKLFSYD